MTVAAIVLGGFVVVLLRALWIYRPTERPHFVITPQGRFLIDEKKALPPANTREQKERVLCIMEAGNDEAQALAAKLRAKYGLRKL
jgi:hypothetical protein